MATEGAPALDSAPSTLAPATEPAEDVAPRHGMCKVTICVQATLKRGEVLAISGSHLALGSFFQAVPLHTKDGRVWYTRYPFTVPAHVELAYKYCVFSAGEMQYWEDIPGDRVITPNKMLNYANDQFGIVSNPAPVTDTKLTRGALSASKSRPGKSKSHGRTLSLQRSLGSGQLLFVMYDLPIHLTKSEEDGSWSAAWDAETFTGRTSPSIADNVPATWIGCVTCSCFRSNFMPELTEEDRAAITRLVTAMGATPIFLDPTVQAQNTAYCAGVLWPALHNVVESGERQVFDTVRLQDLQAHFLSYRKVNRALAAAVQERLTGRDIVWVHGYECCLIPEMVASANPASTRPAIGLYFHSPFPTSEIFRTLSHRDQLLKGMLMCDIIGFHAFNHARHFMTAAKRILGLTFQSRTGGRMGVTFNGREVMLNISHVSVPTHHVKTAMCSERAKQVADELRAKHRGKLIIAGIDHCSRLSGTFIKLLAVKFMLTNYSDLSSKLVVVQRMVMNTMRVKDSLQSSREIRELVASMNREFGPVVDYEEAYSYSMEERVGLYHAADILLHAPLREGVNLIPLEYIYARGEWQTQLEDAGELPVVSSAEPDVLAPPRSSGSLIVSEFATASHVTGAHHAINPWNVKEVAATIDKVMQMTAKDTATRLKRDFFRIKRAPLLAWTESVLLDLLKTRTKTGNSRVTQLEPSNTSHKHNRAQNVGDEPTANLVKVDANKVKAAFAKSKHRVIFMDYGGTLFSHEGIGQVYKHEFLGLGSKLSPKRLRLITQLAADPNTTLFVVTGTGVPVVGGLADVKAVGLAMQHGLYHSWGTSHDVQHVEIAGAPHPKASGGTTYGASREWERNPLGNDRLWAVVVEPMKVVMDAYVQRVNGSVIRNYEGLIAFDFRNADPEWAQSQAAFLTTDLENTLRRLAQTTNQRITEMVKVECVKTRVEVSLKAVNKGNWVRHILRKLPATDFVMAIGDDVSDESMFDMVYKLTSSTAGITATPPSAATHTRHNSGSGSGSGEGSMLDVETSAAMIAGASVTSLPLASPATAARAVSLARRKGSKVASTTDPEVLADAPKLQESAVVADMPNLLSGICVNVGIRQTNARHYVQNVDGVFSLLRKLVDTLPGRVGEATLAAEAAQEVAVTKAAQIWPTSAIDGAVPAAGSEPGHSGDGGGGITPLVTDADMAAAEAEVAAAAEVTLRVP